MMQPTQFTPERFLTAHEAAQVLSVDTHTLAAWRSAGKGPAIVKFGGGRTSHVRYRLSDVHRWMADPAAAESVPGQPWRDERRRATKRSRRSSCSS